MSRTSLTILLIATFGFLLTTQNPILLRSSSLIKIESKFLKTGELADKLEAFYKSHPEDLPQNVYVFTVAMDATQNGKNPSLTNSIRSMSSAKETFVRHPNGYVSEYIDYSNASEVKENLLSAFKKLTPAVEEKTTTLANLSKSIVSNHGSSEFVLNEVTLSFRDLKHLDHFFATTGKLITNKADNKYLIVVVFDNVYPEVRRNRYILAEKDIDETEILGKSGETTQKAEAKTTGIDEAQILASETNSKKKDSDDDNAGEKDDDDDTTATTTDASDTNNNGNTNNYRAADPYLISISAPGIAAIFVTLFIVLVLNVGVGQLYNIKTPNTFVTQPLHIGREH